MSLLEARRKFIQLSGRRDLSVVRENGSLTADWYLNAGQKMLDGMLGGASVWYIPTTNLSSGSYKVVVPYCRWVDRVWVVDSANRSELKRKSLRDARATYAGPLESATTGRPAYYTVIPIGLSPSQIMLTDADFNGTVYDYQHISFGDHTSSIGILLLPPADGEYSLQVLGKFWSPTLEAVAYDSVRADDTAYTVGAKVKWSSTSNTVWACTTAGTSAASAPSISGLGIGDTVTDGTAVWTMISLSGTTFSYWTEQQEPLLIAAALAELADSYGNREGYAEKVESIQTRIKGIAADEYLLEGGTDMQLMDSWEGF